MHKITKIHNTNQILYSFLSSYISHEELPFFLLDHNLFAYFINEFSKNEFYSTLIGEAQSKMQEQKNRYAYFLNEIKIIVNKSRIENKDILFMKGYVLAKELFENPSQRKSLDMDLLTSFDNLDYAHNLLLSLNYKPVGDESYTNSISHVKKYETIRNELTHVTAYKKIIMIDNKEYPLHVDLHIRPFHYMPILSCNDLKSLINRKRHVYLDEIDCNTPTLGISDTCIHLCAHFMRHFYWEYLRFLRIQKVFFFRIDLLHEIALFLSVHLEEFDWHDFIDQANYLNQIEPVYLTFKLINHIYNNIPSNVLNELESIYNKNKYENGFSSHFIKHMLQSDYNKLIFSTSYELANSINNILQDSKKLQYIYNKGSIFSHKEEMKKFYFNLNKIQIDQNSNLMYKYNQMPSSTVQYQWSENMLHLSFEINNNMINQLTSIRISISTDESLSALNEIVMSNDKNFNIYSMNFLIKDPLKYKESITLYTIDGNKTLNKDSFLIEGKNKISLNLNLNEYGIKLYKGRFLNIQSCLEYKVNLNDLAYIRETTLLEGIKFNDYDPWIPEFNRYKLLSL